MSLIDDKINGLSSEELDMLNSDPKMLSDFKAKYSSTATQSDSLGSKMLDVAKSAVQTALPSEKAFEPLKTDESNPIVGGAQTALDTLRDPTRISPTVSEPGHIAGQEVENKVGSDWRGKAANFMVSALLDPQTYVGAEGLKPITQEALNAGSKVGKQVSKLQEVLTGVDAENFQKLFNDPAKILGAEPSSVTGKAFQAAKEAAGLTTEEERKLAINEGARKRIYSKVMSQIDGLKPLEVGEQIPVTNIKGDLPAQILKYKGPMMADSPEKLKALGLSDDAIKEMTQPTYDISAPINDKHPVGSTLSTKTLKTLGYDIPERGESAETPSVSDLLRAKKAGQLIAESNPSSSGLIQKEIHEKLNPLLKEMAPDVYSAQQAVHLSKVKESLLQLFPQGKGMMNYFRTISMLAGGLFHGVGTLESPIVQAGLTLGAKGTAEAANSPLGRGAAMAELNSLRTNPQLQSLKDRLRNNAQ